MKDTPIYFAVLSHQIEDGPSGPARSYFDIKYGTPFDYVQVGTVLLHHIDNLNNVEYYADQVAQMMNTAYEKGRKDELKDIQKRLGIKS